MEKQMLEQFAKEYPTPSYIFDLDMLIERIRMMKKILGDNVEVCYAMKANPFLIKPIQNVIDKYEVCSPGEFHICEEAGIPMEQIVLSGVYKQEHDIADAMQKNGDKGIYTIESRRHLQLLEACAAKENIQIKALIRVTSGNQFGVDEEEVHQILSHVEDYPHVSIQGLQCYSGTQKKKASKIEKELAWMDELTMSLQEKYGVTFSHMEYGPGFYVPYFENDEEVNDTEVLKVFAEKLKGLKFSGKITLEMGRFIAAYCGYYATRIVDQKVNKGQNYIIVDGGINHLNYFGQAMAMKMPHHHHFAKDAKSEKSDTEATPWNICGSLCTVNDVLVKQMPLVDATVGDALVFERVGAYSVTEGIYLFLSRNMPRIYFWSKADGFKEVRQEIESYKINSCIK